jgi:lipoprotein signal peptidase
VTCCDIQTCLPNLASYRRVNNGHAFSCHTEPKGWGYIISLFASLFAQALTAKVITALANLIKNPSSS